MGKSLLGFPRKSGGGGLAPAPTKTLFLSPACGRHARHSRRATLFSPISLVGEGPGERARRFNKPKTGAPPQGGGAWRAPAAFANAPGRAPCAPTRNDGRSLPSRRSAPCRGGWQSARSASNTSFFDTRTNADISGDFSLRLLKTYFFHGGFRQNIRDRLWQSL